MLKKLIAQEWKTFWKLPAILNLCVVALTVLGTLMLTVSFKETATDFLQMIAASIFIFYFVSIFCVGFGIVIYTGMRFYKTLYSDEGYLSFTLPVTPRQHLIAKVVVATIWNLISSIVVFISIWPLLVALEKAIGEQMPDMREVLVQIGEMLEKTFGINLGMIIFLFIAVCVLSTVFSVLMIYSSVTLGQTFKKHKIMGAILFYIAEYMVLQTLSSVLTFGLMFQYSVNSEEYWKMSGGLYVGIGIISLVGTVLLFIQTRYFMEKKLNLD